MPTYGRGEWFCEALESALAQTFTDFEIVIGDNGDDDTKRVLLSKYSDPRIRYIQHPINLGAQGNWVELVRLAESPLVASLHDDDLWEPDFLERLVPVLDANPHVDMVFCDFWLIDRHGELLEERTEASTRRTGRDRLPAGPLSLGPDDLLRLVAVQNAPQPAYGAVFRRSAGLIDFPDEYAPLYDIWLSYCIAMSGGGFAYVPRRLTRYRQHPGSTTWQGFADAEDRMFHRIVTDHPGSPVVPEIHEKWAWLRWGRAGVAMVDSGGRIRSQVELRAAAPYLSGGPKLMARVCGSSSLAWRLVRLVRLTRNRLRRTPRVVR